MTAKPVDGSSPVVLVDVGVGVVDAGVVDAGVVVVGVVAGVVVVGYVIVPSLVKEVVSASTTTVPCMNGWIEQM